MAGIPTFEEVTKRYETMANVALKLAQAREVDAKARLTHAKARGVEFQVMAAYKFLQKVEQETRRLRRQARGAKDEIKKMKKQWRSAKVLFRGRRTEYYSLRRAHLELLLQEVMSETADELFESSPTGKFDEQFNAMFWESHPYSWPVVGWPSDLKVISKAQADAYFDLYYAPNNLTGVLVGNFDTAEVKTLSERYFGRLTASEQTAPDVVTLEMEQLAEKRMVAECDCQPQVEVRYHTVPFMHVDSYALQVLAGLMNGRTGRLYKSLVLDKEIASSAAASQSSDKYAGAFSFGAEAKGDATPEQLESAWYEQLKHIADEPIPPEELQKVKNQIAANAFRRLESPFFLMIQLAIYESRGDWNYINTWADKTLAVTEEDVKRVVGSYFGKGNRAVAEYYRKEGVEAESFPPELVSLPEQQQQMVKGQIRQLRQMEDLEQLQQILSRIEQQKANAPPELQEVMSILEEWLREHIAGLESGSGGGE